MRDLHLVPGVSLAVLVAGVPDDLPGEGEELVTPGEHRGNQPADLRRRLVHRHLHSKVDLEEMACCQVFTGYYQMRYTNTVVSNVRIKEPSIVQKNVGT